MPRPSGSGIAEMSARVYECTGSFEISSETPDSTILPRYITAVRSATSETRDYSFEAITKAFRLIGGGARSLATNPDATGPSLDGPLPATGAIAALITKATGMEPDIVAGIEAGLHTILVLTGISGEAEINRYPFRPDEILAGVHELVYAEPPETEF